jgi:hypothetical protein
MTRTTRTLQTRSLNASALLVFACCFSGCDAPMYYKCEGVVTHDGKPVADLQITFLPVIVDSVRSPVGLSDPEGKFEMTTARFRGVPKGEYKVFVEDPVAADGRHTSKEAGYLYVTSQYGELTSDVKYVANKHRTDFELKLDTRVVPGQAKPDSETEVEADQVQPDTTAKDQPS